ncbi:MAG: hypothetical protein NTZ31_03860 [Actinobacteria bacterium]|jgi:hypothetical protein|nr:hypothetical protein [Actinomycetota bacterium]
MELMASFALGSTAVAALVWWLVPIFGVSGAIIYVVWVSKFQDKYENETNRSVNKFSSFQETFRESAKPPQDPPQFSQTDNT